MKKLLITIIAVMLVLGAAAQTKTTATNTQKQTTTVSSKPAATQSKAGTFATVTIQTNASKYCKSCFNRFKDNVPFFKGVKDYTFDPATAKLTVTYDTNKTTADQIRKQISDLGYDADNVKANEAARAKLPPCCRKESCGM